VSYRQRQFLEQQIAEGEREQEQVKNSHALTAYLANNKALQIRLAPAAAGITEYMGLWWERLFPAAATANIHPSPSSSKSSKPPPSSSPSQPHSYCFPTYSEISVLRSVPRS